jgi:HlyD family secretion protein
MSDQINISIPPAAEATSYAAPPQAARRRSRRWLKIGFAMVLIVLIGASAAGPLGLWDRVFNRAKPDGDVYVVRPTTLNVVLKEDGELKPVNSVDVKCEVQGQGMSRSLTIKWIVEESAHIEKGELLVELASDEMQDRVETEEMELRRIASKLEEVEQALMITRSENASAIRKAEIDLQVAELELKRYTEGEHEKQLKEIKIAIQQAKMNVSQLEEELENSRILKEKDFVTEVRIRELEDSLTKAKMTLEKHVLAERILEEYERPKNEIQKRSAVERATEELAREKQRAQSREKQALARVEDQRETLKIRQGRLDRTKAQLEKCKIYAPVDGMVQYGESGGRRWWSNNRIGPGEQVNPGQTLLSIPDTSQMMVTTRIHEADRHRVGEGMTCLVRVPAVPGQTFVGRLSKIAQFADSERSWLNPDLKEHSAEILLEETDAPLSPGDTAHVEILVEEIQDVLAIPVQCVFARGPKRFVFVREGHRVEPMEVETGRSSLTMIEVIEGLTNSQQVVMAPTEKMLASLPMPGTGEAGFGARAREAQAAKGG